MTNVKTIKLRLLEKGVTIACPESVEIDESIDPARIDPEVVIHSGCRIYGAETLICRGAVVGREAPVTVENCQIGPGAVLNGGFYKNAVFLKGASTGSGAHVREGTIFEEYASAAHTVGVKQTVLFPYVTLGSLINFCDCLMTGGTGPKNHSEVGSSYIHFNFTPQQDKATPSLMGDVPRGVMLNQAPIFLGGQGGLVGPTRLAFGTVIAAGTIQRKDEMRPSRLIFGSAVKPGNISYQQGGYRSVKRIIINNLNYIANLIALRSWYSHIRYRFVSENMPSELYKGLNRALEKGIEERIQRLKEFSDKLAAFAEIHPKTIDMKTSDQLLSQKPQLQERWGELESSIRDASCPQGGDKLRDRFLELIDAGIASYGKTDYIAVIRSLDQSTAQAGTAWLDGIVNDLTSRWLSVIPAYELKIEGSAA